MVQPETPGVRLPEELIREVLAEADRLMPPEDPARARAERLRTGLYDILAQAAQEGVRIGRDRPEHLQKGSLDTAYAVLLKRLHAQLDAHETLRTVSGRLIEWLVPILRDAVERGARLGRLSAEAGAQLPMSPPGKQVDTRASRTTPPPLDEEVDALASDTDISPEDAEVRRMAEDLHSRIIAMPQWTLLSEEAGEQRALRTWMFEIVTPMLYRLRNAARSEGEQDPGEPEPVRQAVEESLALLIEDIPRLRGGQEPVPSFLQDYLTDLRVNLADVYKEAYEGLVR